MRIFTIFLLFVGTLFSVPSAEAASTTKVGGACTKVGALVVFKGSKLVCKRVGKKAIWQRLPVQEKISILAPSVAQAGAGCVALGVESFTAQGPLRCVGSRWVLVPESDDSIASRAFRSVLARYNARAEKSISLEFVMQPDAPAYLTQVENGMRAAARLWSIAPQRDEPYPVLIGTNYGWLRAAAGSRKLTSPEELWTNLEGQSKCSYAQFNLEANKPWYIYCFAGDQSRLLAFLQVGAHEYTHLVQYAYLGAFDNPYARGMAPWFQEGYASYVGAVMGFASGGGFALRNSWVEQLQKVQAPLAQFNERFGDSWYDVYPMGAMAAEVLTALYGIDVMEQVLLKKTAGRTFDSAMIETTGKSVDQWSQIIQGYIDSVRIGSPWSLSVLKERAA